jgi:hypothetical protein
VHFSFYTTPTRLWLVYFKPSTTSESGQLHISQVRRYRESSYEAHKKAAENSGGYEPSMRLAYHIFLAIVTQTRAREQPSHERQYWKEIHRQIYPQSYQQQSSGDDDDGESSFQSGDSDSSANFRSSTLQADSGSSPRKRRLAPSSLVFDSAGRSHSLRILDKPWGSSSCRVFPANMDGRTVVVKVAWHLEARQRIQTEVRLSRQLEGLRGVVEYVGGLHTFEGRPAVITAFAGVPIQGFGDLTWKQR